MQKRKYYFEQLTSNDFEFNSAGIKRLKNPDCTLILFYSDNIESYNIKLLWSDLSSQIVSPSFCAVNITKDKIISEYFSDLKGNKQSPFHWISTKRFPFILCYKRGFPTCFYNGEKEVDKIMEFVTKQIST